MTLHVVTGAPCAGKSTFVREHRSPGDMVVDMDALASALGAESSHGSTGAVREAAIAARAAAIEVAKRQDADAWVIHTSPSESQRRGYGDAAFHDLDPGLDECLRRAEADGRPPGTADAIRQHYRNKAAPRGHSIGHPAGDAQPGRAPAGVPFFMPRRGREGADMAEETIQETEQAEQAEQAEDAPQGAAETDWKAEARKWERLAKKGKAAEDELEALRQQQMTEQEKATARAEKAEAELAAMKADAERLQAAREVSEREGVPLSLLEFCQDADAMERFASAYAAEHPKKPVHAAPTAPSTRIVREGEPGLTNARRFEQFAAPMFRN